MESRRLGARTFHDSGTSSSPTGGLERRPDVGDHLGGPVPQHPARKAQEALTRDDDLVLQAHVRIPRPDPHVLAAVDLDVHPPLVEVDVAVAPTPVGVAPDGLARRFW